VRERIILGIIATIASASACYPPPEAPETEVYVGALSNDSDAAIALAVQGDYVAVYACAQDPTRDQYPRWLTTGTSSEGARIVLAREGWTFEGAWNVDGANGTLLTPDGRALHWVGAPAPSTSLDGLYAASDSGCTTGVIVTTEGGVPVLRGAWCDAAGDVRQITPMLPLALVNGRLSVEIANAFDDRRIEVAPVQLPMP
jgi:hypothetical protein